uniref:C2 domain-containing protein n=1 Tax=Physcomitrium patens TaxID=3218 RepID=A0A7I4DM26_PHYPA
MNRHLKKFDFVVMVVGGDISNVPDSGAFCAHEEMQRFLQHQRRENNPIWNEFFELEFDDLEDGKVMVVLLDEAAPQEFQVLGYCQFFLQAL